MNNEKENIKKEFEDLKSNLNIPETKLDVPDGYYEMLEEDILNKTIYSSDVFEKIAQPYKVKRSGMPWIKIVSAVAASIILAFGIRSSIQNKSETIELQLAKMSNSELDIYINDKIAAIDMDELNEYLPKNVQDFDTELLFETNFISDAQVKQIINENVSEKLIIEVEIATNNETLLDPTLLQQLDDQSIQNFINEESLFDELAF